MSDHTRHHAAKDFTLVCPKDKRKIKENGLYNFIVYLRENPTCDTRQILHDREVRHLENAHRKAFLITIPLSDSHKKIFPDCVHVDSHLTIDWKFAEAGTAIGKKGFTCAHYTENYSYEGGNKKIVHVYFDRHGNVTDIKCKLETVLQKEDIAFDRSQHEIAKSNASATKDFFCVIVRAKFGLAFSIEKEIDILEEKIKKTHRIICTTSCTADSGKISPHLSAYEGLINDLCIKYGIAAQLNDIGIDRRIIFARETYDLLVTKMRQRSLTSPEPSFIDVEDTASCTEYDAHTPAKIGDKRRQQRAKIDQQIHKQFLARKNEFDTVVDTIRPLLVKAKTKTKFLAEEIVAICDRDNPKCITTRCFASLMDLYSVPSQTIKLFAPIVKTLEEFTDLDFADILQQQFEQSALTGDVDFVKAIYPYVNDSKLFSNHKSGTFFEKLTNEILAIPYNEKILQRQNLFAVCEFFNQINSTAYQNFLWCCGNAMLTSVMQRHILNIAKTVLVNDLELLSMLLRHGANPNSAGEVKVIDGNVIVISLLSIAIVTAENPVEYVRVLLNFGATEDNCFFVLNPENKTAQEIIPSLDRKSAAVIGSLIQLQHESLQKLKETSVSAPNRYYLNFYNSSLYAAVMQRPNSEIVKLLTTSCSFDNLMRVFCLASNDPRILSRIVTSRTSVLSVAYNRSEADEYTKRIYSDFPQCVSLILHPNPDKPDYDFLCSIGYIATAIQNRFNSPNAESSSTTDAVNFRKKIISSLIEHTNNPSATIDWLRCLLYTDMLSENLLDNEYRKFIVLIDNFNKYHNALIKAKSPNGAIESCKYNMEHLHGCLQDMTTLESTAPNLSHLSVAEQEKTIAVLQSTLAMPRCTTRFERLNQILQFIKNLIPTNQSAMFLRKQHNRTLLLLSTQRDTKNRVEELDDAAYSSDDTSANAGCALCANAESQSDCKYNLVKYKPTF